MSDNVVKILHLLKCCQEESPEYNTLWTVVPLSPDQYKELWQHLEKDEDDSDLVGYVKAKIQYVPTHYLTQRFLTAVLQLTVQSYDYDAFRCQFTLRQTFKPSHAVFKNRVVGHIESQLDRLRSSSNLDVATHAGKIMNMGSSHIRFHLDNAMVYESDQRCSESVTASDKEQYRCPDCSFRHRNCRDSSVVIEISHPQKRLAMNCLAEDYIFGTNGNIKVVIGLHIEYQGRQKATMSVWVPKITSEGFFVDKKVKATVGMSVIITS